MEKKKKREERRRKRREKIHVYKTVVEKYKKEVTNNSENKSGWKEWEFVVNVKRTSFEPEVRISDFIRLLEGRLMCKVLSYVIKKNGYLLRCIGPIDLPERLMIADNDWYVETSLALYNVRKDVVDALKMGSRRVLKFPFPIFRFPVFNGKEVF